MQRKSIKMYDEKVATQNKNKLLSFMDNYSLSKDYQNTSPSTEFDQLPTPGTWKIAFTTSKFETEMKKRKTLRSESFRKKVNNEYQDNSSTRSFERTITSPDAYLKRYRATLRPSMNCSGVQIFDNPEAKATSEQRLIDSIQKAVKESSPDKFISSVGLSKTPYAKLIEDELRRNKPSQNSYKKSLFQTKDL